MRGDAIQRLLACHFVDAVGSLAPNNVINMVLKVNSSKEKRHHAAKRERHGLGTVEMLFHRFSEAKAADEGDHVVNDLQERRITKLRVVQTTEEAGNKDEQECQGRAAINIDGLALRLDLLEPGGLHELPCNGKESTANDCKEQDESPMKIRGIRVDLS